MDPMQEILQMFFVECEEHLETLQEGLEVLKQRPDDIETVNTVFRAVHSIKGGSAAFGLGALVEFAHTFETTLDDVRSGRLSSSEDVVRTLLRSADVLNDLVTGARDGEEVDPERIAAQIASLVATSTGGAAAGKAEDAVAEAPAADVPQQRPAWATAAAEEPAAQRPAWATAPAEEAAGQRPAWATAETAEPEVVGYRIRFHPHASLFERCLEPARLLRELAEIGNLSIRCDISTVPSLDEIDPAEAYLSWEIEVTDAPSEAVLREVFDFVDGDCDLTIEMIGDDAEPEVDGVAEAAGPAVVVPVPAAAPVAAPEVVPVRKPVAKAAAPKPAEADAGGQQGGRGASATVRVDLDRVDRLINLVGELVINQAMLSQSVIESGLANSSAIAAGLDEFKHLTREVQESVLAIRAQPVKSLFQRMSRIVREAADATGKAVRFVTEGEMTEVDKTVIERLADPLTHMIRNAVDHGLERTEDREARGKSAEGTVRLTAEHRSGRVLIEITDDGAGINRERVQQIAVDKGLIPADAVLSNNEIDNLLFLPGFSTAKTVSDLSGRGVGMDVVKRSIASLGGRISISSQPGEGTCFSISLPLTLAILDGMIVTVASETVVVPLSAILEMLKPDPGQIHPLGGNETVVQVRGEFVPVIDVGHQLGFARARRDCREGVMLLIETSAGERRSLVVDAIQDQRQVVIKGLEGNYGEVSGIAAATILGDGRIALILDTDAIVADAARNSASRTTFALAG